MAIILEETKEINIKRKIQRLGSCNSNCIIGLLIITLCTMFSLSVYFLLGQQNNNKEDPTPRCNISTPEGLHIYTKREWYGVEPTYEIALKHPTPFVIISDTGTPACFANTDCTAQMRSFQDAHMGSELQFSDIGYSFVVGGDGNVYEGRGWDATNVHNGFVTRCNIGITLIGNFSHHIPTNSQINAVQELIRLGVKIGKLSEDYKLVAINETYATLSPGAIVYEIIKSWPHFWIPTEGDVGLCP